MLLISIAAAGLIFGAEFTRVWAEHHGGLAPPDSDVERVVQRKAVMAGSRN